MDIREQVINIKQARALKELGVKQNSWCYFYQEVTPKNPNLTYHGFLQDNMPIEISVTGKESRLSGSNVFSEYSAFTVAELGVMLGKQVERISISNGPPNNYLILEKGLYNAFFYAQPNEVSARAELLIFILKTGFLSIEVCNSRLTDK